MRDRAVPKAEAEAVTFEIAASTCFWKAFSFAWSAAESVSVEILILKMESPVPLAELDVTLPWASV